MRVIVAVVEIIEFLDHPAQIPDPVAVAVRKRAYEDLVKHAVVVVHVSYFPIRIRIAVIARIRIAVAATAAKCGCGEKQR